MEHEAHTHFVNRRTCGVAVSWPGWRSPRRTDIPWQVPGGLAFADFRGYEDWQVVAVSHNGDKLATILGNPALIEAFRAGIPGNGKPFPDGARFAKIHWTAKTAEDQPGPPTFRARCTTSTSW